MNRSATGRARYIEVLRIPGALRVFLPSLVGRLAFAMVTLALLFAVQSHTGSFAIAGAATGAFGLANVVASPFRARLVDRFGQRVTLNSLVLGFSVGMIALAWLVSVNSSSAWSLVAVSAVTGFFPPPLGAAMRVMWGSLTVQQPAPVVTSALRTKAYSVDAVSEELLFTTGPLIAAAIILVASPVVGLLATAAVAIIGTVGMTTSRVSLSHVPAVLPARKIARPLRQPAFLLVLVALLSAGIVLGTIEVAAPAYATQLGSVSLAGVLLAVFSAGSAVGGLFYGHREWRSPLKRRLVVLALALTMLCAVLSVLPNIFLLATGLAVLGLFFAPSLVSGYLLADELTLPEVRTEASSWINTAINTGASAAAAGVGLVVEVFSPLIGFATGAAAALLCLTVVAPALLRRTMPGTALPDSTLPDSAR